MGGSSTYSVLSGPTYPGGSTYDPWLVLSEALMLSFDPMGGTTSTKTTTTTATAKEKKRKSSVVHNSFFP